MRLFLSVFFTVGSIFNIWSQSLVTLDSVLSLAMDFNYDIKIVANNIDKAETEKNIGNAGMLPEVQAQLGYNGSNGGVTQETFDGQTFERRGAVRNTFSGSVNVNQNLFDGLIMFRTYDKLGKSVELQNYKYREEVENMTTQVIVSYYELVRDQNIVALYEKSLEYGKEQLDVIQRRKKAGRASLIDVLNSEVNLAEDSAALLDAELNLQKSINYLSFLVGGRSLHGSTFDQELVINREVLNELGEFNAGNNVLMLQANTNIEISMLDYQIYKGMKLPQVMANVGFNYSDNNSDFGFASRTRSNALVYGVTATWNIFQGFKNNIRIQTSKIEMLNQAISKEKVEQNLTKDYEDAKVSFKTALSKVDLRKGNIAMYTRQFEVTEEMYKIGRRTTLEMRTAQEQLLKALNDLFIAEREAKVFEIELKRLAGKLLSYN